MANFKLAAKTKAGVDPTAAQGIVEKTVRNADPASFPSLSPASADSFTAKVCHNIINVCTC